MQDELDILKEVGSTAAAHGSTALSEILERKITLKAPTVKIIPCSELLKIINTNSLTITIQSQILSGLKGRIIYILEEKSAYKLTDIYNKLNYSAEKFSIFTEISMSLIKEVGNVVIASYAGALGFFLKKVIIPSIPVLINAPLGEIVRIISSDQNNSQVVIIESVFEEIKEKITGNFWLILTDEASEEIQKACKKLLEDI